MTSRVLDLELAEGIPEIPARPEYDRAYVLARWRGRPLGTVWFDLAHGEFDPQVFWRELWERHSDRLLATLATEYVGLRVEPDATRMADVTVAVCTRDRPDDLRRCLAALSRQSVGAVDILVVDNAPSDSRTREVCADFRVRYVREDVKGLNWARRRAALESGAEIIAYTDDDAAPEPRWLEAMLRPFASDSVAATSGLAVPLELETEGQEGFERSCPMSRGFQRRTFDVQAIAPVAAALVGLGACMAIRRELVIRHQLFDVDLDAGSAARSGGDTYAFFCLLRLGHQIVYTPDAIVWHRHRRTRQELADVLRNYSIGTYVFLLRCLLLHGETGAIAAGAGWFLGHHVKQLLKGILGRRQAQPLSITLAEIHGVLLAPGAFIATRRREKALLRLFAAASCAPEAG